jgi:hypothetical protein
MSILLFGTYFFQEPAAASALFYQGAASAQPGTHSVAAHGPRVREESRHNQVAAYNVDQLDTGSLDTRYPG